MARPSKARLRAFPSAVGETSSFLDSAYYEAMLAETTFGRGLPDAPEMSAGIGAFLTYEARLLDEGRHEDWLALFTTDCTYWFAAGFEPYDPRKRVAVTLDDRRRLTDRLARLATGTAYSQILPSRTQRVLGASEVWHLPGERLIARTGFALTELREENTARFTGRFEHVLVPVAAPAPGAPAWAIAQKRIFLIDGDLPLTNVSFVF